MSNCVENCKELGSYVKGTDVDTGLEAPCDATYLFEYFINGRLCTKTAVLTQGDPIIFENDLNETAFIKFRVRPDLTQPNACVGFDAGTGVVWLTTTQGQIFFCYRNMLSCVCP